MTELICRYVGIVCFVAFTAYGAIGTLRAVRTSEAPLGPRPWALFAVFELVEAVQVYGLLAPRPGADVRGGAIVAVAALFFCVYLQHLYFVSLRNGRAAFPRAPFYIGVAILLGIVLVAHVASPHLP
jgi:hypothetical protein